MTDEAKGLDILKRIAGEDNITDLFDEEKLKDVGRKVVEGYKADLESRREWEVKNDEWLKLATQHSEEKTYPWPKAANIKYPLMTTAALQFHARAYPALVPATGPVKSKIVGKDQENTKGDKGRRIAAHMNFQLTEEMEEWEEDMDKLCIILPLVGTAFKKTYYSPILERNVSQLVSAKNLVVNYWSQTLETAPRITHVLYFSNNDIYERQKAGIFRDVDVGEAGAVESDTVKDETQGTTQPNDDSTPHVILEQHCFYDFDGDGYEEPWVVSVQEKTGKVLRIVPRFDLEEVELMADGTVARITPLNYFTKFSFIPNPDGGFYDLAFGVLLGGLNETANTLINQLIDAGSLNNLPSGFLSRRLKLRSGNYRFSPGEWKIINATADELKNGIYPLPAKEPSGVLFQLLGIIISSGEKLSSVTDMMVGQNPGQNQPATTSMAVLEQGMKVFTAIYKRVHKSLKKEFKKLYRLNKKHVDLNRYQDVLDEPVQQSDYDDSNDIIPAADPNVASDTQKLLKAQSLLELMPLGHVNPKFATRKILEAQGQEDIEGAMTMPESQPDPKMLIEQKKLELQELEMTQTHDREMTKISQNAELIQTQALLNIAKAEAADSKQDIELYKARLKELEITKEDK